MRITNVDVGCKCVPGGLSSSCSCAAFARKEDSDLSGARLLQVIFRRIIKADYLPPPNVSH